MKNLALWLLLCLLTFGAKAQVQLGQETFEGLASDAGYTSNSASYPAPVSPTALEYFLLVTQAAGTEYVPYSRLTTVLGNQQGQSFWAAEGVRGTSSTIVRPAGFVLLNGINTANHTNLKIKVAFSAARGLPFAGAGRLGVMRNDKVLIQYSFDGTNFTDAGRLTGDNTTGGGRWKRDVNMSGDATDDAAEPNLNQAFTDYTFDVSATGSLLRVRIVADFANSTATELAFDNIRVEGTVNVVPQPVLALDASESGPIAYTEGDPAVPITNTLAVTYPNGGATLTGATVQIISGYVAGQDVLGFATLNGISAQSNTNGTLTLTGTTTLANYQAALRSVTYQNTNATTATGGPRAIGFTVRDGARGSNTPTRTVNVTAVLNAPAPLTYTEDFETDGEGTRYTATAYASQTAQAGFFRSSTSPAVGPGGVTTTNSTFSNYNGSAYWYGKGTRILVNPAFPLSTLQLAPVNATNYVNLRFTLRMGRGQGSQTTGWDTNDFVKLYYRTSGAGSWVLFGAFYGSDATGELRRDADLNGLPDAAGTLLTSALQDVVFGDNTATTPLPNSIAGAALSFKIETGTDDEELVFDYIRISGTAPPTVTTTAPAAVTGSSALLGGTATADGGNAITGRGVVYSTTDMNPTIGGAGVTQDANGTTGLGAFSKTIGGLTAATTYYVRAYATNAVGTSYGAAQSFTTPTTVVSIVRNNASLTNATSVGYTVTFAASVAGGAVGNFSLTAPGLTGPGISSVSGTGAIRTVVVSTGTGSGSLTLNLANATGISPGIGNALPFVGETYTIDKAVPTVVSVGVPANGSYSVGQHLDFTVNFSEAVTVTTTGGTPDLGLTVGSGSRTAGYLSGSGTTALVFRYTVVSGDLDPNGIGLAAALGLNGGTIRDAVANNAALTLSGVPATAGVLVDGVAPTVTSFSGPAASGSTTSTSPLVFSVSFSESVSGFAASGITVTNGTVSSGPSGSGSGPYAFSVTPTTAGTATTVTIAAGAAKDAAGNFSTASTTYSLTYLPPSVTVVAIAGRTPTPTATATVSYRVTFSGSLTGLSTGNFNLTTTGSVSGAAVASVSGAGTTYIVQVNTGTGDGTLRLNLNNGTGTTPNINGLPTTSGTVYTLIRNNTFFGNPQLTVQGSGSAGGSADVAAFVDGVQVLSGGAPVGNALQNGSFETNNVGPAGYTYGPQVSAAPWAFNGLAGVARNGSAFGAASPPQGDAVAFIQGDAGSSGSIAQGLNLATGSYQVRLQASQRACCGAGPRDQELYVLVNGVCLGLFQPTNPGGYDPFTSLAFAVRAPSRVAGQLLRFAGDATPGYVDFSADATNPAPLLNGTYTQTAWVKPGVGTGPGSVPRYVLGNGIGNAAAPYLAVTGSGQMQAGFGTGSAQRTVQTGLQAVAPGVWSYVAVTYDGGFLRLYLNGELQATLPTNSLPASTRVNFIGSAGPAGLDNHFPGDIDEVSQWTRALSQAELRLMRHRVLSGGETGLVSYLQFNDSGPTTTDFVRGSVGTLTGATRLGSTAPVSYGPSSLVSVTGAGPYAFAGTSAAINFSTPGTTPYDVVVSRLDGPPLGMQPTAAGLTRTYTPAYWIVNRYSASPFAATVTYTLSPTDLSPADAAAFATTLRLFKRGSNDDGAFPEVIAASAANAAAGTVSFPVTSFSQTVIGTLGSSPLPVELVRFTAMPQGADALLRWATASERNNDRFEVEVSADGRTFQRIGQVAGQGSSAQPHEYQLVDRAIARYAASPVYYRLRQVDTDGTFSYSPVRTVAVSGKVADGLLLFPNPTSGTAMLTGTEPGTAITVLDALGRQVLAVTADATGTAALVLPHGLATGVYVVRVGSKALRLTVE